MKFQFLLSLITLAVFTSCDKDKDQVDPNQFSFAIPDSLVFAHSQETYIPVTVVSESDKGFFADFETLPPDVFGPYNAEVAIAANQTGNLPLTFHHTYANPGTYTGVVNVYIPNENNANQTKEIKLIYRPNCLYSFRDHIYGQLTYVSNGILLNKTISCFYDMEGRLDVSGLTFYDVILNANCDDQTVTMVPLVYNGSYMTGSGQIEGDEIALQIFSDGVLLSNCKIKPF
jgi:hypothetical protein